MAPKKYDKRVKVNFPEDEKLLEAVHKSYPVQLAKTIVVDQLIQTQIARPGSEQLPHPVPLFNTPKLENESLLDANAIHNDFIAHNETRDKIKTLFSRKYEAESRRKGQRQKQRKERNTPEGKLRDKIRKKEKAEIKN